MPCTSRVTNTSMTDAGRVEAAMRGLGYQIVEAHADSVQGVKDGRTLTFSRSRAGTAFTTRDRVMRDDLNAIQRSYSEIGVRQWAKARGFSVAQVEQGRKFTLVNRRK